MGDDVPPRESSDRRYPARPVVGVGVVVVKGDAVLVVQRGSEPGYGEMSVPGGAVELGETLREAATREVAEECGIAIEIVDVVEVLDRLIRDEGNRVRYHYVLIDFVARYNGGELGAGSDILAARWVPLEQLEDEGLPSTTLAVIRKALDALR